ncbi:MAG: hypothetical protein EKK33_17580 [Bradyrhizobiaceae bacterium]|nr:MAG: hypothetical protein EKK33_17580 [Bradyrhizobiaceae bacterium]
MQNIPARAAAEASAGSGHDLFGFNGAGGAHLYRKFFIDVSDLVKETEKQCGEISVIDKQGGDQPSREPDVESSAEVISQGGQFKHRSMLADVCSDPADAREAYPVSSPEMRAAAPRPRNDRITGGYRTSAASKRRNFGCSPARFGSPMKIRTPAAAIMAAPIKVFMVTPRPTGK